jgi:UTP:GlnB (protein PII) uridylyltransferase
MCRAKINRVVIDNDASDDATVIRVDSVNSHGTLLAVVQVIADLNLVIRKAYFSSDGSWFMDGQYPIAICCYFRCSAKL